MPAREVGEVGGDALEIEADGGSLRLDVDELRRRGATALPRALGL